MKEDDVIDFAKALVSVKGICTTAPSRRNITDTDPCRVCQTKPGCFDYLCGTGCEGSRGNGAYEGIRWLLSCPPWGHISNGGIGPDEIRLKELTRLSDERKRTHFGDKR